VSIYMDLTGSANMTAVILKTPASSVHRKGTFAELRLGVTSKRRSRHRGKER
jgi:hypothetical protein